MQIRDDFERYLSRIDLYFEEKSKNTFQAYCAMLVVLVFSFAYLLYYEEMYDNSQELFSNYQNSVSSLSQKQDEYNSYFSNLDTSSEFVRSFVDAEIRKIRNNIAEQQRKKDSAENTRTFFRNKLNDLSYLLFSTQKGAGFLKNLTELAVKYNINIYSLQYSEPYKSSVGGRKVGPALEVLVDFSGNFKEIVKYINAIEKSQMVVDINYLNFTNQQLSVNSGYGRQYASSNSSNLNTNSVITFDKNAVHASIKIYIWGVY